ncbi:MAG: hypothetical protein P8144_07225 [Gammaproteobacteria bacterium]
MFTTLIGLPVLVLLSSITYLFIDLSKPKAWIFAVSVIVSQLTMIAVFVFLAILLHQDQNTLLEKIQDQHTELSAARQDQKVLLARLSIDPEKTKQPVKRALLFGLKPNNAFFQRIDAANTSLKTLLESRQRLFTETGISVLRLPEDINQKLVQALLLQLGFRSYYADNINADNENTDTSADTTNTEDIFESTDDSRDSDAFELEPVHTPATTPVVSLNFNHKLNNAEHSPVPLEPLAHGNALFLGSKVTTNTVDNSRYVVIEYNARYDRRPIKTDDWIASRKQFK